MNNTYTFIWNSHVVGHLNAYQPDIIRELNSENSLDLIFGPSPGEKVVILTDTHCIIYANRKFVLDMPSDGSFQDTGL